MRTRLFAVSVLVAAGILFAGCTPVTAPTSAATTPAVADGTCAYVESSGAVREVTPPPAEPTVSGTVAATLQTSVGDIPLQLDADRTPCTVGSFASLAEQGYFDGTDCHRLTISGIYVLQCGDPSGTGMGGPGYEYADELDGSELYPAGTVAMANAGPDTNGSQFFLVYEDSRLPAAYTVFGRMDEAGLAAVQQVAAAGTASGTGDGAPATPVTIDAVTIG